MKRSGIYLIAIIIMIQLLSSCQSTNPSMIKTMNLKENWTIISSKSISKTGKEISTIDFDKKNWINVTVPTTVLSGLIQAGIYTDVYYSNNLAKIDKAQFSSSWWYRTEFQLKTVSSNQFQELVFEGINYKANIWLNGQLIADTSKVEGVFAMWNFDVSKQLVEGANVLAIEIFPPIGDDLSIGFVDWNPAAPDANMGIWRPVKIRNHGNISLTEPFVQSEVNTETLDYAELSVSTTIKNHTNTPQKAVIQLELQNQTIIKKVELAAKEKKDIVFSANEFDELKIKNPDLWWPNHMGEPNLHWLNATVKTNNTITDQKEVRYGIRKVEEYWTESKHKGYKINGQKVLIKGAGWVDDLLLADSEDKVISQVEYVKQMNMNTIRLEGFWGNNKTLYEKADELGLLVMIGWSCHWEWEGYCKRPEDEYMAIRTPKEQEAHAQAYMDQVKWLRNHPSVFLWVYGSDKLPRPELERKLNNYMTETDPSRPTLATCKYADFDTKYDENGKMLSGSINESEVSGAPGVKMRGPYAYTTPIYWYTDTNAGGAFGFNTETGPGAQIPPLESLKKMIPKDKLWPMNEIWDYHSGRNEFSTLWRDLEAFNARYGKAKNIEDFAFNMQIHNYEAIRAMFEAFEVNKHETTGLIQWMLNSAWPEMFWQLYDWYLLPNGAFYGTQKANEPINAIYNYGDKNIYLTNSTLENKENLTINIQVWDIESNLVFNKSIRKSITANSSELAFEMPELQNLSSCYFINLRVQEEENVLTNNFYWLSIKADVIDWDNSVWFYSPYKSYANFKPLHNMPKTKVESSFSREKNADGDVIVTCTLQNTTNKIAFFNEVSILDKATGETIVPVFWDDNYLSLLPGETRTVSAKIHERHLQGKDLSYRLTTFNGSK